MINLNNVEELISLELHRASIALAKGLVRTANAHMDEARVLEIKRELLEEGSLV